MTKKSILFVLLSFCLFSLFGEISFENPDLNSDNELLFTINQKNAGSDSYNSLFYTKLENGMPATAPDVITCYPEQMDLLDGGNILQIRNRHGVAQYDSGKKSLKWVKKVDQIPEQAFHTAPYAVSPDGKYLCKIEKKSLLAGDLILESVDTGKTFVLAEDVLLSYKELPVKWAPDSTILLYEKDGGIYFCNPEAVLKNIEVEERYRKIGRGTINSVCWASSKYIAYIDDYLLYRIGIRELYTLGLYSGIVGQGKAMGRLPFQFDCRTDSFSANQNASSIVITQNHRLFTYLSVSSDSCDYMDVKYSRPYTDSSASLVNSYVFWDIYGNPILWQEKLPYNGYDVKCSVYKLTTESNKLLEIQNSGTPILSEDKSKVAFYAGTSLFVYDINTWQRVAELSGEKIISILWINESELYVGGENTITRWGYLTNKLETITLSSVDAGYWVNNNQIVARQKNGNYYQFDRNNHLWHKINVENIPTAKTQNGRYRVFLGSTPNRLYKNALYVRSLGKKAVTKPIFDKCVKKSPAQKKVALAFDFYDNADGLPLILYTLKKYNVPGTFFLNGEFIRRYPMETKQIVANGHDCASMFFTPVNLCDNTFVINEDFIRRGLARNEDEFFDCTGKELSLYWHAPFYAIKPEAISFGDNAGYTYVYSSSKNQEFDDNYKPEVLIENIYSNLEKSHAGVMPIVGGFSKFYNVDPLYNYLDIIISSLIEGGYQIVDIADFDL